MRREDCDADEREACCDADDRAKVRVSGADASGWLCVPCELPDGTRGARLVYHSKDYEGENE